MSEKTLRSAVKRKAVEDPTTCPQRKNKHQFRTEDTIAKTPSPRVQRLPLPLPRDKSFCSPSDEEDINLSDKDPMNPKKIIPTTFVPQYKQVHTNANHTTISLQKKHANLSTLSSHSTSISAEDTFNIVRQYPTPVDFLPNTKRNTASVSRRPLQEIDLPAPPNTPTIDDKHSVDNRSFTIIDDDDNNPNKENTPSSSKDMFPHWVASRRRARSPPQSGSPTQPDSSLQSGSTTLSNPPLQSDSSPQYDAPPQYESHSPTHSLGNNDHSASLPSGSFNELGTYIPFNTVPSSDVFFPTSSGFQPNETDQQPNNTVGDYQQPNQTIGDLLQQAKNALDREQQAAHTFDAFQQATHTLDADQQDGPTANDVTGEELRQRFINLHVRHMKLLETVMNNLAPFQTLLRDDCVNERTEGSDRFERNFPSSYKRLDIAQDRLKALSDNFLESSDAKARPFAL